MIDVLLFALIFATWGVALLLAKYWRWHADSIVFLFAVLMLGVSGALTAVSLA